MEALHNQAYSALPTLWVDYEDIKPVIDAATGYDVEFNGAHQLLRELEEFGLVARRDELTFRDGHVVTGSRSFWRSKADD